MRVAVWVVLTGLTVTLLVCTSGAISVAPQPFYPDSSLQRVDSIPPGTPILSVWKIRRGQGETVLPGNRRVRNSEGDSGSITWRLTFPDPETRPRGVIGYIFHFVDGYLPARLEFTTDAWANLMREDSAYPYIAWTEGTSWQQDAFKFRMYITVVDSAGNESLPSNIVEVAHNGTQEERQRFTFEQYYFHDSVVPGSDVRWDGVDGAGRKVSLVVSRIEGIELDTGQGTIRGHYMMHMGDEDGQPHRFDIFDNIEVGPHTKQLGIYEMRGDSLRLCLAPPGDNRPARFHHDGLTRLYTLRKTTP